MSICISSMPVKIANSYIQWILEIIEWRTNNTLRASLTFPFEHLTHIRTYERNERTYARTHNPTQTRIIVFNWILNLIQSACKHMDTVFRYATSVGAESRERERETEAGEGNEREGKWDRESWASLRKSESERTHTQRLNKMRHCADKQNVYKWLTNSRVLCQFIYLLWRL